MREKQYSNYDFENLTEIYFKNPWLRKQANHIGFENLWSDYTTKNEKRIVKRLINNFRFVSFEQAELDFKPVLESAISEWNLNHHDTIFVGFKQHKYADGSAMFLHFLRGLPWEIDDNWAESNYYDRIKYGNERIRKGGNSEYGIELKNVVLVDDFIGTGRTAVKRYNQVKNVISDSNYEIDLYIISFGGMKFGLNYLYKNTFAKYKTLYVEHKGTNVSFKRKERKIVKRTICAMENILSEGNSKLKLKDHRLGWGKSETIFTISRFNIPNNNYPIFWWNRYRNKSKRKTLFNRMQ